MTEHEWACLSPDVQVMMGEVGAAMLAVDRVLESAKVPAGKGALLNCMAVRRLRSAIARLSPGVEVGPWRPI